MRDVFIIMGIFLLILGGCSYMESKRDPYEEGSHWDYSIICSDGFKYKHIRGGIIPCYNSDGTRLKCNQTKY